jgi:DEAD/DEAH box helicase domain-containing protein
MAPIFKTVLDDPKATTLYIFPLNALVNDQLKAFVEFEEALRSGAGKPVITEHLVSSRKKSQGRPGKYCFHKS